MKKQHRLISFILVLSLIFSSLVFTAGAAEESGTGSGNDLTQTEFFKPTATYTKLTTSNKTTLLASMKASWSAGSSTDANEYLFGDPDLETYFVAGAEEGNTNEYLLVRPSETAAKNGKTQNHAYFSSFIQYNVTYGKNEYYVFEVDIATESSYLPLGFVVNSRYDTDGDGVTNPVSGSLFESNGCDALMNVTPGVFYHLTLLAHPDTNILYVYLNDRLIETVANGVMTAAIYENTYTKGNQVYIQDMRIQRSPLTYNMSVCIDNFSSRIITPDSTKDNDISDYAGTDSLDGWADNKISLSSKGVKLPSLITVNGVTYNNTIEANKVLDTYKLGTKAEMHRSCYSSSITVNCDAVIKTSLTEVDLVAGPDVTLTKGDGSSWIARLTTGFKHSAITTIKTDYEIISHVRYPAEDNLLSSIHQNNAVNPRKFTVEQFEKMTPEQQEVFTNGKLELTESEYNKMISDNSSNKDYITVTTDANGNKTYEYYELTKEMIDALTAEQLDEFIKRSITGNVTVTDDGNEYLIIKDATDIEGDFPLNVHYQINAYTDYRSNKEICKISNHKFVVFEQDIYSESSFINVYNGFMLRTPNSDQPLSATTVFAENLSVKPNSWHHLTYVGEVETGDSYLFLDGECMAVIKGGLWDNISLDRMADDLEIQNFDINNITDEIKNRLISNMVLGSFRTMQIAGENKSGQTLTPDMSAASDNYYLRWVDETVTGGASDSTLLSTIISSIKADYNNIPDGSQTPDKTLNDVHNLYTWSNNIFNDYYNENVLPELAVLATINGVEYFDTTSINDILDDEDYTTPLQEVIFYREYIGTVTVNCRAAVTLNGITSTVKYSENVEKVDGSPINVYKQTPNDTATTYYPIACVGGVLYYADGAKDGDGHEITKNETALKKLLEENTSETEYKVTFLRVPTVETEVKANAILDFNGLSIDVVIDENVCARIDGTHTTKVVNLKTTLYLATMNGVDYKKGDEGLAALQAAITAADTVELQLYNVPSAPLKITCPASIDTNGLITDDVEIEDLITTDFYSFDINATGKDYDYEIKSADSRYATIQVNIKAADGTHLDTQEVTAQLGDDIASVLSENGLMNNVFITKDTNGTTVHLTAWDITPSGVVSKEDPDESTSAYVFTATVSRSVLLNDKYAYVDMSNNVVTGDNIAAWFNNNQISTIILNSDANIASNTTISNKNIYLNGYTINNNSQDQGFSVSSSVNFYGDGTINYLTVTANKGLFFSNYNSSASIKLNGVTINTASSVAIIRNGSLELNECTVKAYTKDALALFSLGEQYNGYSDSEIKLTLRNSDITYRYANVVDSYTSYTTNKPLIYNKIVTHKVTPVYADDGKITSYVTGEETDDAVRTIIIDSCTIKSQGSLVSANASASNAATDYLKSNMSLYVNNTDIVAKSLILGNIKPNSVFFCDDVRTNVESKDNILFSTNLVAAKTSDGIYNVLYTSHAYAPITWSDGTVEIWASGSTPVNRNCLFDKVTSGGVAEGNDYTYGSSLSSGESFPFNLYMNLTLSSDIGFNIYVPTTLNNGTTEVSHEDIQVYMDGKLISPNTYANENSTEIRTSFVAVANSYCYDYTLTLAPQDAAKNFTLVIIYNGQYVSRKISVADYAEKLCGNDLSGLTDRTKALLQVTLAYIEQATMFAGNTVDMSRISALRSKISSMTDQSIVAPTLPEGTEAGASDFSTKEGGLGYIQSAQLNLKDSCAFRFNLASTAVASKLKFYVATDDGTDYELRQHTVAADQSYVELSLRAYELTRSIKIVYNNSEYDLYSLYDYYYGEDKNGVYDLANPATAIGSTYEYKATEKLIQKLYTYASVCDKYYDKNAAEYDPSTTN